VTELASKYTDMLVRAVQGFWPVVCILVALLQCQRWRTRQRDDEIDNLGLSERPEEELEDLKARETTIH